jgi:hypothetical protein
MKLFIFLFLFISCVNNQSPNEQKKQILNDTLRQRKPSVISGKYGELSVAVDTNGLISGVYEFYNDWDNQLKEFMQTNVFYFMGTIANDTTIRIKTAWPTSDQKLSGKITIHNKSNNIYLKLLLNDMPDGYASANFVKEGLIAKITEKKAWRQIRLIKASKARIFDSSDSSKPRKAYLVANDVVKILETKNNDWMKIEFNNKNNNAKSTFGWIKENVLYNTNLNNW